MTEGSVLVDIKKLDYTHIDDDFAVSLDAKGENENLYTVCFLWEGETLIKPLSASYTTVVSKKYIMRLSH